MDIRRSEQLIDSSLEKKLLHQNRCWTRARAGWHPVSQVHLVLCGILFGSMFIITRVQVIKVDVLLIGGVGLLLQHLLLPLLLFLSDPLIALRAILLRLLAPLCSFFLLLLLLPNRLFGLRVPNDGVVLHEHASTLCNTCETIFSPVLAPGVFNDPILLPLIFAPAQQCDCVDYWLATIGRVNPPRSLGRKVDTSLVNEEIIAQSDGHNYRPIPCDLTLDLAIATHDTMRYGFQLLVLFALGFAWHIFTTQALVWEATLGVEAASLDVGPNSINQATLAAPTFLVT